MDDASLSDFDGTLVLVGAGKMGGAMLEGWHRLGLSFDNVVALEPEPSPEIITLGARGLRINPSLDTISATAIVLAVKPQVAPDALRPLAPMIAQDTVIVSIMAGRTLAFLEKQLPAGAAVVRAMPNTPAAIGRGITVAVPNARIGAEQRTLADKLLRATGAVEWIADETLMDAVTAVSGSGPAYVFLLAESLARAGTAAGLAGRSCRAARARDRRGLRRVDGALAARSGDLAQERHLAGGHHCGGARCAHGEERPRSGDGEGDRRRDQAFARARRVRAMAALEWPRFAA